MDRLPFASPIYVRAATEVLEIQDVDEALEFLRQWPERRRGPVYGCAVRGCNAAVTGRLSTEDARKSFASFARVTGILAAESLTVAPAAAFLREKRAGV